MTRHAVTRHTPGDTDAEQSRLSPSSTAAVIGRIFRAHFATFFRRCKHFDKYPPAVTSGVAQSSATGYTPPTATVAITPTTSRRFTRRTRKHLTASQNVTHSLLPLFNLREMTFGIPFVEMLLNLDAMFTGKCLICLRNSIRIFFYLDVMFIGKYPNAFCSFVMCKFNFGCLVKHCKVLNTA